MKTITAQKGWEEIIDLLEGLERIYLIGCGTCATMCRTGGKAEVLEMKARLEEAGKAVSGWMVIPAVCDELTKDALIENAAAVTDAEGILVLSCSFGVQTAALHTDKPVLPALDTLFVGQEETPGHFIEVCGQCGSCVLGRTAGICPLIRCAKSLFNGPCGGSVEGKCEVSPDIPCVWQLIYDRLAALGQLDRLENIHPVQDWSTSQAGGPRKMNINT